jgi:hypothetical protein
MSEVPFITHPERLGPERHDYEAIRRAHGAAVASDTSTYRDPTTGLMVFTSAALRDRGWCCERGCRHCPYPTGHGPLARSIPVSDP